MLEEDVVALAGKPLGDDVVAVRGNIFQENIGSQPFMKVNRRGQRFANESGSGAAGHGGRLKGAHHDGVGRIAAGGQKRVLGVDLLASATRSSSKCGSTRAPSTWTGSPRS